MILGVYYGLSTVDAPYGLVPINLIGGQPYAGSTRQMKIASGYATDIFNGDVVKRAADGTVQKETGTATVTATGVIGVFVGCSYTDPNTEQKVFKQYYPASTVASDIMAYVVMTQTLYLKSLLYLLVQLLQEPHTVQLEVTQH